MKTLPPIVPTAEQLALISENRFGVEVIRGAAGSGKTSTAILRLRSLLYMVEERFERQQIDRPVRILVTTFNRTLKGYISALAESQVAKKGNAEIVIDTFGHWAMTNLGHPKVIESSARDAFIFSKSKGLPLTPTYVSGEVDYLLGRFEPELIEEYITTERTGRGLEPRVDRHLRRQLLDQVVYPYRAWLSSDGRLDWNDVAVQMARTTHTLGYDIAVVDESQDFSANQLRAVRHHLSNLHAVTFVIDTLQRIYARGFTWQESGFVIHPSRYHVLKENHRNTKQIAQFAAGVLEGITVDTDGAMPNLKAATRDGDLPKVVQGLYRDQVRLALEFIKNAVDLSSETVAFLQPLGGGYFNFLRYQLLAEALPFVEITREADWPDGPENIALSTFHSAKGLEFDHVFILGLNAENTTHGDLVEDDQINVLRRLFAVAIARARQSVTVGYKPAEASRLISFLKRGTFQEVST